MSDNVHKFASSPDRSASSSAGGGGGGDVGERLARLETKTDNIDWKINNHLATKEGMKHLEALIEKKEATLIKWIVGMTMVAVGLILGLIKIFGAPG